jgi:hypothetical protein
LILSSCVYFLALRCLLHWLSRLSRFWSGAEVPLPSACPGLDGEHDGWRSNPCQASGKLSRSGAPHTVHHGSEGLCRLAYRSQVPAPSVCQDRYGTASFFLRECLTYVSLRRLQSGKDWTGRRSIGSTASLLCPIRVASVSRLIG